MVNINRLPGTKFLEDQMEDSCTVDRDSRGIYDEVLNEATGMLESPNNDFDKIIYSGMCVISRVERGDKQLPIADMPKDFNYYKVLLPLNNDTGNIRIGDRLTMNTGVHDPIIINKQFRVSKVDGATHPLYRRLIVEDILDSIGNNNPAAS
jgi:hypothetical protein